MLTLEYLKDKAEQLQKVTGCLLCIAGGAPRDILNNKPVKDIDVFIAVEFTDEVNQVIQLLKDELGFFCKKISGSPDASDSDSPVYETEWEGHKWQFIFKQDSYPSLNDFAYSLFDDFDYTFCQVAVVPYGREFICNEGYEIAILHKQINRNPNLPINNFYTDKAKTRLKRLQDKYPEYTVEPLPEPRNDYVIREQQILRHIREIQAREPVIQPNPRADIQWIDDLF